MGIISVPHLYNLADDPGEQNNLAKESPEKVKESHEKMMDITERVKEQGV